MVKDFLEYKGYHAKIEFDAEDMILVGEVFGIQDSLNFHGETPLEVEEMFHQSIDNYLELCANIGKKPDKEFRGSFNVRIDQKLHREAAIAADQRGITLNQFVENAISAAVSKEEPSTTYVFSTQLNTAENFLAGTGNESSSRYRATQMVYS